MTAGAEPAPRRSPVRRKRPRARGESGAASTTPDSPSARPKTANRDDATLNAVRPPPPQEGGRLARNYPEIGEGAAWLSRST